MNKIKKFCADNKQVILLAGISVTVGLAGVILHNSLMKGTEVISANLDPFNTEIDESVDMRIIHRNGNMSRLVFYKNV